MESKFTQLENQVEQLKRELMEIRGDYYKTNFPSKMVVQKDLEVTGRFIQTSVNPTATFGLIVTPVGRQANIAGPSGGATVDTESRSAINSILAVLDTFGFTL